MIGEIVTIGRIKGNIKQGLKIFKVQSKVLNDDISPTFKEDKEFKKIKLNAKIIIKNNQSIILEITGSKKGAIYYNNFVKIDSSEFPEPSKNKPLSKEDVVLQLSKTGNTPFTFENIEVILDDNLFVPIKTLNSLRRKALEELENKIIVENIDSRNLKFDKKSLELKTLPYKNSSKTYSLLLTILNKNTNYSEVLDGIDKLYIPLKHFILKDFKDEVRALSEKYNTYVYLPNIIRDRFKIDFGKIVDSFNIKGFVISSISQIQVLEKYNLEMIGNYNLNVYNKFTIKALQDLGLQSLSLTPELNDEDLSNLICSSNLPLELGVYGKIPLMTMNYCPLGRSNKCYKDCKRLCETSNKFYLKDRLGFDFRVLPDNFWNLTKIYNSKITSFDYSKFDVQTLRIDILDEDASQIKQIIQNVKQNIPFKGKNYCGHFNKFEPQN